MDIQGLRGGGSTRGLPPGFPKLCLGGSFLGFGWSFRGAVAFYKSPKRLPPMTRQNFAFLAYVSVTKPLVC